MFALIAAVAKNNCIGKNNRLPWHIPEDLEHFRKLTNGKTVLMGQNTFNSILSYLGKPLPNRKTVVISSDSNYKAPEGVRVFNSIEEPFKKLKNEEVFVAGGASIYKQTINLVDKLYITHIHKEYDGDVFFPKIDPKVWKETKREDHDGFSFVVYEKINNK